MRQSRKERQITNMMKSMQQASREEALKLMYSDQQLHMETAEEWEAKPVHPSVKHKG